VPCIQGCTTQKKYSVVPAGAVTVIEIVLCLAPSIAMLSPGPSRPGRPLSIFQWMMSLVGPGGACGFLICPATIRLQTLSPPFEQALIYALVDGRFFLATTEIVCGSSAGLPL